jgi:hypothetical protein
VSERLEPNGAPLDPPPSINETPADEMIAASVNMVQATATSITDLSLLNLMLGEGLIQ